MDIWKFEIEFSDFSPEFGIRSGRNLKPQAKKRERQKLTAAAEAGKAAEEADRLKAMGESVAQARRGKIMINIFSLKTYLFSMKPYFSLDKCIFCTENHMFDDVSCQEAFSFITVNKRKTHFHI